MNGSWQMYLVAVVVGVILSAFGCATSPQLHGEKFGQGGTTTTSASGTGGDGASVPCSPTLSCKDGDENPCTKEDCIDGFCVVTSLTMAVGPGSTECTTIVCNNGGTTKINGSGACGTSLKCNGAGQCTGCMDVSTCPKPLDCEVVTCKSLVCEVKSAPAGAPSKNVVNTPNDCKKPVCDGNGGVDFALDDVDHPLDDKNPCTDQACDAIGPIYPPSMKGTMCASTTKPNVKVCDGSSACVECVGNSDCNDASMVLPSCDTTTLTCVSCSDKKQNGTETGIDCGGSVCKKCNGDSCSQSVACMSSTCADQVCCDMACSGVCLKCDLPGKMGTCSPIPKGIGELGCTGAKKACDGTGTCETNVSEKQVGMTCSKDADCYTGACNGTCRLANFAPCAEAAECASLRCLSNVCTACLNNNECASGTCTSGRCEVPAGGVCLSGADCAGGNCDNFTKLCGKPIGTACNNDSECVTHRCNGMGVCAPCSPLTQIADCANDVCDVLGYCLLSGGALCTADGQCVSMSCVGFPAKCQ